MSVMDFGIPSRCEKRHITIQASAESAFADKSDPQLSIRQSYRSQVVRLSPDKVAEPTRMTDVEDKSTAGVVIHDNGLSCQVDQAISLVPDSCLPGSHKILPDQCTQGSVCESAMGPEFWWSLQSDDFDFLYLFSSLTVLIM